MFNLLHTLFNTPVRYEIQTFPNLAEVDSIVTAVNVWTFVDYFDAELFSKMDGEMQTFLLKTSFLQPIDPQAAAELTDNEKAAAVLADLSRNNFFTERRSFAEPL